MKENEGSVYIKVENYLKIKKNPEIFSPEKIDSKLIKKISLEKNSYISSLKEKNGLIFIISHKINSSTNQDIINYASLNIDIFKNSCSILEKMNHIEIPKEAQIKKENFIKTKFLDYDIFKVDENISFIFILLIDDFYLYKIRRNPDDDNLNYKKLEFVKIHRKLIFLGNYLYENNILECSFISRPDKNFIYLNFNLSSLINSDEIEYKIQEKSLKDEDKNSVLLKRLKRGINVDKYIIEEEKKFFLIYKDKNNVNNMLMYPYEIIYKDTIYINKLISQFYSKFGEKIYMITDLTDIENINKEKSKTILGIFEIYFNTEKNIYTTKLSQEIFINKNNSYDIHYLSNNQIIIIVDKFIMLYIKLDSNCSVEKIYQFIFDKISTKRKYVLYENDKLIRIIWYLNNELFYISINKTKDDNNKTSLEDYESFVISLTNNKLNYIFKEEYNQAKKAYNSIKKKLREQKKEIEQNENIIENCAKYAIEVTKDEENNYNNTNNQIKEEKNTINANYNKNQLNINQMNSIDQLNYFKQMNNQINQYKLNQEINQINSLNQRNALDPRLTNPININNLYQPINRNQFNNFQNNNNINMYTANPRFGYIPNNINYHINQNYTGNNINK